MLLKSEYCDLSEAMVLNISDQVYWVAGVLFHNASEHLVIIGTDGCLQWHLSNIGMDLDHDT